MSKNSAYPLSNELPNDVVEVPEYVFRVPQTRFAIAN
jgi:hypothetical protein